MEQGEGLNSGFPPSHGDEWENSFTRRHRLMVRVSRLSDELTALFERADTGQLPTQEERRALAHLHEEWVEYLLLHDSMLSETSHASISPKEGRATTLCLGAHVFLELARIVFLRYLEPLQKAQDRAMQLEAEPADFPESEGEAFQILMLSGRHFPPEMADWCTPDAGNLHDFEQEESSGSEEEQEKEEEEEGPQDVHAVQCLPVNKRIMMLTQSELVWALAYLAQRIKFYSYSAFLGVFIKALLIRHAQLCCYTSNARVIDDSFFSVTRKPDEGYEPPDGASEEDAEDVTYQVVNRDYLIYTYFYFMPILSRVFYQGLFTLPGNRLSVAIPDGARARFIEWVKGTVLPSLGKDAVSDRWYIVCAELLAIPGDRKWFRYQYPNKPDKTVTILSTLRPALAEHFIAMTRVSDANVLAGIGERPESDLFMLDAIGMYFHVSVLKGLNWRDVFTVRHEQIPSRFDDLAKAAEVSLIGPEDPRAAMAMDNHAAFPLLLETCGVYGVWYKQKFFPARDTLEAALVWFLLVDRMPRPLLRGIPLKRTVLDPLFRPVRLFAQRGDGLYARPLE